MTLPRQPCDANVDVKTDLRLNLAYSALVNTGSDGQHVEGGLGLPALAGLLRLQLDDVREQRDAELGVLCVGECADDAGFDARPDLVLRIEIHSVGTGTGVNEVGSNWEVT
ncbi:hypothetical protein HYQ46_012736 [Verticillium longisporum]|nr:hypothetical protein HYQ46_012736 [Verticillium longisporum]